MADRFTLLASAVVLAFTVGCSGDPEGSGGEGTEVERAPTVAPAAATNTCSNHEPGCPCPKAGARVYCGVVSELRSDGRTVCGPGGQVCENGAWSACTMDAYAGGK